MEIVTPTHFRPSVFTTRVEKTVKEREFADAARLGDGHGQEDIDNGGRG
jgi:hypothetical protein